MEGLTFAPWSGMEVWKTLIASGRIGRSRFCDVELPHHTEECQSQEKDSPVQGGKVDKQCRELGSVVRNYSTYCTIFSLKSITTNIQHLLQTCPNVF